VESLIFAVRVRPQMADALRQQAVDLTGPLEGVYGRSRRLLGFESIRAWLQTDADGRLTLILLMEGPDVKTSLEAQMKSPYPIDDELKKVFMAVTGLAFDAAAAMQIETLVDWRVDASFRRGDGTADTAPGA
jgi:hypothetical protein